MIRKCKCGKKVSTVQPYKDARVVVYTCRECLVAFATPEAKKFITANDRLDALVRRLRARGGTGRR